MRQICKINKYEATIHCNLPDWKSWNCRFLKVATREFILIENQKLYLSTDWPPESELSGDATSFSTTFGAHVQIIGG